MRPRSEFTLGWKVVVAAMVGVACGASPIPYNTIGFIMGPIHDEFGWSFRDVSLGLTICGIAGSLLAPVYGALADRIGVRPVALCSLLAFGLSFAMLSQVPGSLVGYWLLWLVVGIVGFGSTPVTWTRGINLWFFRRRGLALGITLVGTSLTAILVPPLAAWSVQNFGWRSTFPILALLPLLVALPVGLLLFREPRPEQRPAELTVDGGLPGITLAEAVRGYRFWLIWASVLCVAFAYGGVFVHLAQMLVGHGFTLTAAAGIVSTQGLAILAGRVGTGFLLDRFWAPLVTLPLLSAPAVACWLLAGDGLTAGFAVMSAVVLGLATGAETDLIAFLAGRYFGMAHYGRIYGMLYVPFGLASSVSPAVYGWVRDTTGDYDAMLYVAMGLFTGGAVMLLGLGRYPEFGAGKVRPAE
ncbi:MAG: MFS transporter [Chromatiales bacterium]|nr:MFS transporter [Chromatiales bacterium]